MPGCLGLDAMWQLVGFFLAWCGNPGKGRALGCAEVKFVGEVFAKSDISEVYNSSKKNNKKRRYLCWTCRWNTFS